MPGEPADPLEDARPPADGLTSPPADPVADRRLDSLRRAAAPGRLRGITLDLFAAARAEPHRAAAVLRHGLREARALHSWERRVAADGLRALVRLEGRLRLATGSDDPLRWWQGWLVSEGLPAELVDPTLAACADLDAALAGLDPDAALAARASVPLDVALRLRRAFGDRAEAFVDASDARAPVVIRPLRPLPTLPDGATRGALAPDAVCFPPGADLRALHLPPHEVQDEASQLVALCVPPGLNVLDRCAGAGGKALHLADRGHKVTATDARDRALHELARRAGRRTLRAIPSDRDPGRGYDCVLIDAPCSGTGTWRRHPELRWRLDQLDDVRATQAALLDDAFARVRPGGYVVYATCSVLREENDDAVLAALARHPGAAIDPLDGLPALDGPFLRTDPDRHGTDGFFAARLRAP
jgi:16S rRNA (cytosine967-C5)-methyltransferase